MIKETMHWKKKETGGILFGYFPDNESYIITDISTAGPQAIHNEHSFIPDYDFDVDTAESKFFQSSGVERYLGDWHSHPNSSAYLSPKDKKTLKNISLDIDSQLENPIMLIVGTDPLEIKCWCYKKRVNGSRSIHIQKLVII